MNADQAGAVVFVGILWLCWAVSLIGDWKAAGREIDRQIAAARALHPGNTFGPSTEAAIEEALATVEPIGDAAERWLRDRT